jgi:hypothetical protein
MLAIERWRWFSNSTLDPGKYRNWERDYEALRKTERMERWSEQLAARARDERWALLDGT